MARKLLSRASTAVLASALLCLTGWSGQAAAADPFEQLKRRAEKLLREQVQQAKPVPERPAATPTDPAQQSTSGANAPKAAAPAGTRASEHVLPFQAFTSSDQIVPVQLPVLDGAPVIGYSAYLHTLGQQPARADGLWRGDAQAVRWLTLLHVARSPQALDDERFARHVAVLFLPPAEWETYLSCIGEHDEGRIPNCAGQLESARASRYPKDADSFVWHGKVRNWRGRNEFERPRSHRAFVEKYRPILLAQASALPQEVVLFSQIHLHRPYSARDRGLPLQADNRMSMSAMALHIAGAYCATNTLQWPTMLPLAPEEAETLLDRLDKRMAYWGVRLRLKRVDGALVHSEVRNPIGQGHVGNCGVEADIVDLTLFADAALRQRVHGFAVRSAPKAASTQTSALPDLGQPGAAPAAAAAPEAPPQASRFDGAPLLNHDALRLLVIRQKPSWRELLDMATYLNERSRTEANYYRRKTDPVCPAFDPWGPFLTGDVAGTMNLGRERIDAFAAWSQERAAKFPDRLLARFFGPGQGNTLLSPDIDLGDGVMGSRIEMQGQYEGDGLRRVATRVESAAVAPASHVMPFELGAWSGNGMKAVRDAAIVFPRPVASYRLTETDVAATRGNGQIAIEVLMQLDGVRLIKAADSSEILVVRVRPLRYRVVAERSQALLAAEL